MRTPKDGLSWYIKWVASGFLIAAMVIRATDMSNLLDNILSLIGSIGWLWVACLWKDRSLVTLNFIAILILLNGVL